MNSKTLPYSFFDRPTLVVTRELLGMRLVRIQEGVRLSGIITEVEAYISEKDLACHARAGRTNRTAVMYGPPGHAYVYFTYGNHWMLNVVSEPEDSPAAILIRAILPQEGREIISSRRGGKDTLGPGKLTQALGIDGKLNGVDLSDLASEIRIEMGRPVDDKAVITGPRIGLYTVPEPWKSIPWRFRVVPLIENTVKSDSLRK